MSTYKNIKPSPLRLIVLTSCNCNLFCNININIIYHQLKIDENIKSIKLEQDIKGEIKESKKKQVKKNKLKDNKCIKKKKHFINQITIVLTNQTQTINVKLFGNGKIVITGAKQLEQVSIMLQQLLDKMKTLSQFYQIDSTISISQLFNNTADLLKFMEKNSLIFLQLINLLNINMPINWHNLFIRKQKDRTQIENSDIIDNIDYLFYHEINDSTLIDFVKIVQIIKIIKPYINNQINNPKIINNIFELYNNQSVEFKLTYEQLPDKLNVTVNNYNALFESNLKFDREKFHRVLTNKCQILVNYRPSSYQGLNITYYLNSDTKVTFFAFQDGTFMITGNNKWDVIESSYIEMCQILDQYYDDIIAVDNTKTKVNQGPTKFDYTINDQNFTFLNIKTILFNNPRNNYLLKNKGLIQYYCK